LVADLGSWLVRPGLGLGRGGEIDVEEYRQRRDALRSG